MTLGDRRLEETPVVLEKLAELRIELVSG